MGATEIFAITSTCAGLIATICAIIAFYLARKNDTYQKGGDETSFRLEIEYIKRAVDDIRVDIRGYERKQNEMSEKVIRYEEMLKSHEKRISLLEKQWPDE